MGGLEHFFNLHPEIWGNGIQFDEHIFQRGWFNHQLVNIPDGWDHWPYVGSLLRCVYHCYVTDSIFTLLSEMLSDDLSFKSCCSLWKDVHRFLFNPTFSTLESLETWWMDTKYDSLEKVTHFHCVHLRYILQFKGAALNSCWTRIEFKTKNSKVKVKLIWFAERLFTQTKRHSPFHVLMIWYLWYLDAKQDPTLSHNSLR